jgi:hypothetical protein
LVEDNRAGRPAPEGLHRQWRHLHVRGEWFRASEDLLCYIREQAGGGPTPEPDPQALAQAVQFRRVLAALGPADLAVLGVGQKA